MGVIACNQCCDWNDYSFGCVKPDWRPCPMVIGKPKRPTNADRIRAMSDEDLAEWLVKKTVYQESAFSHPSYLNFMTGSDDTKESAIKGTVKWLKQPYEGE